MTTVVSTTRDAEVAVIAVNNPPVNALSQAVRAGLREAIGQADADASVRAVVILCRGRTFIAGADVTEFDRAPQPPGKKMRNGPSALMPAAARLCVLPPARASRSGGARSSSRRTRS